MSRLCALHSHLYTYIIQELSVYQSGSQYIIVRHDFIVRAAVVQIVVNNHENVK